MEAKQTPLIDLRAALAQQAEPTVTEDMKSAVRWAPSSAYWSERLREFFGPDAREGIDALERRLAKAQQAEPVQDQLCRAEPRSDGDFVCDCKIGDCLGRSAALAQQAEPVQEPAFHGFMSDDGTQVDVCFSPSAPRRDGTYATAYYTAPPQRPTEPVQGPEGMVEFLADLQRSRTKYPKNRRMFDGLMGEIDELRRAYAGDGDIRAEAFDVAVCAFRIATEGDAGGNARLEQAEPVSADPHTTTLRNLLECCLSWEPDACVLGNVTARQAVAALRAALAQQDEPAQEPVAWNWMLDGLPYGRACYGDPPDADLAERAATAGRTVRLLYAAPPQRKQAEPLNLRDPAVRKRLATQWGYVPAAQAEPVEPVAWSGYDLDGMVEALSRVVEAHYQRANPFQNPIDMDAQMALRVLRGFIPAMKAYTAPPQREPLPLKTVEKLIYENTKISPNVADDRELLGYIVNAVRAVERAHGIKE